MSVATVKLLDEATNLYKLEIDVVATTPLIVVVSTDPFSLNVEALELIIVEVATKPFILVVKTFPEEV